MCFVDPDDRRLVQVVDELVRQVVLGAAVEKVRCGSQQLTRYLARVRPGVEGRADYRPCRADQRLGDRERLPTPRAAVEHADAEVVDALADQVARTQV